MIVGTLNGVLTVQQKVSASREAGGQKCQLALELPSVRCPVTPGGSDDGTAQACLDVGAQISKFETACCSCQVLTMMAVRLLETGAGKERTKDSGGTQQRRGEGRELTAIPELRQEIVARFRSWFDRGLEECCGHGGSIGSER